MLRLNPVQHRKLTFTLSETPDITTKQTSGTMITAAWNFSDSIYMRFIHSNIQTSQWMESSRYKIETVFVRPLCSYRITKESDYLTRCSKHTADICSDLPCHVSPWLHFPPKQVKSFDLFASMDHLYAALHCRGESLFSGGDLLSVLPSVPRELILKLLNRNVLRCK